MPLKLFFCYAHEDEPLLNELKWHLEALRRQGLIDVWHDRNIGAGTEWEREIDKHLNTAQIILLLISQYFMASDYCYGVEMKRAMERHECEEARVIPVILRPVHWQRAPFGKLQALPTGAKPVRDPGWHNLDEAFFDVAEGIRKVVEQLISKPSANPEMVTVELVEEIPTPPSAISSVTPANQLKEGVHIEDVHFAQHIREAAQSMDTGATHGKAEIRELASDRREQDSMLHPADATDEDPFAYMEDIQPVSLPEQRVSTFIHDLDPEIPDISHVPADLQEAEIEDLSDEGEISFPPDSLSHAWTEPVLEEPYEAETPRAPGVRPRQSSVGNVARPSIEDFEDQDKLFPPDQPTRITPSSPARSPGARTPSAADRREPRPIIRPQPRNASGEDDYYITSPRAPDAGGPYTPRQPTNQQLGGWLLLFLIFFIAGFIFPGAWARVPLIGLSFIALAFFISKLLRRMRQ